jgi:hypothetical protein
VLLLLVGSADTWVPPPPRDAQRWPATLPQPPPDHPPFPCTTAPPTQDSTYFNLAIAPILRNMPQQKLRVLAELQVHYGTRGVRVHACACACACV